MALTTSANAEVIYQTRSLKSELISDETTWLTLKILMFGITPTISIFGIVGNILSIVVLKKQGLKKCSNILLVALAFSDITFLVSFNSVPKIIYEAVWNHEYVGYSKTSCDVLFVMFNFFTFFDYSFGLIGMTMPMLITAERLVVIFLPLNFGQIITPIRTWLAVSILAIYWMSIFTYTSFWQVLDYRFDLNRNVSVGHIQTSNIYNEHPEDSHNVDYVIIFTSLIIPPLFTVTGCVVISVKLQITAIRRQKMTSSNRSKNRTTKTLLGVCAVYCVTAAIVAMPLYIPEYASYSLTDPHLSNISRLLYQSMNMACCINSSSNFVVYVGLNKQFRDTLKSLLRWSKN